MTWQIVSGYHQFDNVSDDIGNTSDQRQMLWEICNKNVGGGIMMVMSDRLV